MIAKILPLALLLVSALAGCTIKDGKIKSGAVTLQYDGNESGTHEKRIDCAGSGRLTGSGDINDGQVEVTVRSSDGDTVFERTYTDDFGLQSEPVKGDEEEWTLTATRSGDDLIGDEFQGSYTFTLNCGG